MTVILGGVTPAHTNFDSDVNDAIDNGLINFPMPLGFADYLPPYNRVVNDTPSGGYDPDAHTYMPNSISLINFIPILMLQEKTEILKLYAILNNDASSSAEIRAAGLVLHFKFWDFERKFKNLRLMLQRIQHNHVNNVHSFQRIRKTMQKTKYASEDIEEVENILTNEGLI